MASPARSTHRAALQVALLHALLVASIYGLALLLESEELFATATVFLCLADFTATAIGAAVGLILIFGHDVRIEPQYSDTWVAVAVGLFGVIGSIQWYLLALLILKSEKWKLWRWRFYSNCPHCGYDLRGCDERGCPECGWDRPDWKPRRKPSTAPAPGAEPGAIDLAHKS